MKILIDANIIVTYLTRRDDPFLRETYKLFQLCAEGQCSGYVALQTVSIVWHILRKSQNHERRNNLKNICNILNLAVTDMKSVKSALENTRFHDFEDNLQDCCAQSVGADYIVTANVRDYEGRSVVKAVTPSELLAILDDSDDSRPASDGILEIREPQIAYTPRGGVALMKPHCHIVIQRQSA